MKKRLVLDVSTLFKIKNLSTVTYGFKVNPEGIVIIFICGEAKEKEFGKKFSFYW